METRLKTIIVICPDDNCWVVFIDELPCPVKLSRTKAVTKEAEYLRIEKAERMRGMSGDDIVWATPTYLMSCKEYDDFRIQEKLFRMRKGR